MRRIEVYAAQTERMDRGIGKRLDKRDALGLTDNTLVMLMCDSAGNFEELNDPGPDAPRAPRMPHQTLDGGR